MSFTQTLRACVASITVLGAGVLLISVAGCNTPQTQKDAGVDLNHYQRLFVETALNDNHGVDELIAADLRRRGFAVEHGPLTMMPAGTQAVITYRDRWTWDFTSYMIELQLNVRDVKQVTPLASTHYYTPAAIAKSAVEMVSIATRALFGPVEKR